MADQAPVSVILYRSGLAAFLTGTLDPMEGSVLIALGSALIFLALYRGKDPDRTLFYIAMLLIVSGVLLLFFFSALGGFGAKADLPAWMGFFLLPYPLAWLLTVLLLIRRIRRRLRKKENMKAAAI